MDINNYSYTPHMLDEKPIREYSNDDMYIEVSKCRQYSRIYYSISAASYDGSLEYFGDVNSLEEAQKVFDYIKDNYSTTPPAGDITEEIDAILAA